MGRFHRVAPAPLILKSTFFLCVLSLQLAYDLVYGSDVKVKVKVKSGRVEL